jgi:hypothetical protein
MLQKFGRNAGSVELPELTINKWGELVGVASLREGLPVRSSSRRPTGIPSVSLHKQWEETPRRIAPAALQIGHHRFLSIP